MRTEDRIQVPDARYSEPSEIRKPFVLATAIYPLWHLAAPASARDPWIAWWLVAASFAVVALLSLRVSVVARNLLTFFHLCSWLVTLHLFLLASANDMQPFFAVGSVMAVLSTFYFIRTVPNLLAYAAFVLVLGAVLFAYEPDGRKLAYWGGMLPVAAACYHRLAIQRSRAEWACDLHEQLERRVAERTAELVKANHRLQAEMKERERLEEELRFSHKLEALGRLAGGVAHDFNNLLTAIGVYSELLLDALPEDSPQRDDVAQIQKSARQAAALTQQLLAFARRRQAETRAFDLRIVVERVGAVVRHLLGEDTKLVMQLDAAPQIVRANPDELEQVLINLALNARDAMPGGGVFTVETRVMRREELRSTPLWDPLEPEGYVMLAATDTGVGMDRETRERAFDPFFTRKPAGEGTGLGLSLIYGVVTRAGGHIRVSSEPGRGSRFELYWPLARELGDGSSPLRVQHAAAGHGERVLVVEDQAEVRSALQKVLRRNGYVVVEADSARNALEIASGDESIDLVVTDIVMPDMSGLELIEALKPIRPNAKVLLVSGQLNHPSLRDQGPPLGVSLLEKPFAADEFAARVREVLDQASLS